MKQTSLVLLLLLLLNAGCKPKSNLKANKVEIAGSLHAVMMDDLESKIDLKSLENEPNVYAIGAMEGLKGEIQMFDSKPFNSTQGVGQEMAVIDSTFNARAAMLVYARVPEWTEIEIPRAILTLQQFDGWLYSTAVKKGYNMDEPLPFLLEGYPRKVDWHIVNWDPAIGGHSRQNHINSGLQGVFVEQKVDIIGFYSRNHQGVISHGGSNMHMHFLLDNRKLAAHIDEMLFGPYMTVKLPSQK